MVDIELKWHQIEPGDLKSKGRNIEGVERDLYTCIYKKSNVSIL